MSDFRRRFKRHWGASNFKVAPDLKKFDELLSDVVLDETSKNRYGALKSYYSKYQL